MRPFALAIGLLLLTACPFVSPGDLDEVRAEWDADSDGHIDAVRGGTDCDDSSQTVNPDADELCNGVDDNCDGSTDEGLLITAWADGDGDGFGMGEPTDVCELGSDQASQGGDCDDAVASVNPGQAEDCANGVDDDCDGTVDEGKVDAWFDGDGDGHGSGDPEQKCPTDLGSLVLTGDDCAPLDPDISPSVSETCNGIDDDCDGTPDQGLTALLYPDADHDGHGDAASSAQDRCPGPGWVAGNGDCDDTEADVNPAVALDVCNGIDDDCDTAVDEDPQFLRYFDQDGDGFGVEGLGGEYTCLTNGTAGNAADCDDSTAAISPDADETCNGIDDDCDGDTDELVASAPDWYLDADNDGYGTVSATFTGCDAPTGYVSQPGDCNDSDGGVSPDASELCDGIDNDCDSLVDDADSSVDSSTQTEWWLDADGDLFGAVTSLMRCEAPTNYVPVDGDCDDGDDEVFPGAEELCDGVDNNCVGGPDENQPSWYADTDQDGFGDPGDSVGGCSQPSGRVSDKTDCDDSDIGVNPDADELCNGIDDNCDTVTDTDAIDRVAWYVDGDTDGFGAGPVAFLDCPGDSNPGFSQLADDCNDGSAATNPDGTDVCGDGIDQDCDGLGPCALAGSHGIVDLLADEAAMGMTALVANNGLGTRAGVGDIDDDGLDEVLVGGYFPDFPGPGYAYIIDDASFVPGTLATLNPSRSLHNGAATSDEDGFGVVPPRLGDLTGDGVVDLVVGAYRKYQPVVGGDAGRVYIVPGPIALSGSPLDVSTASGAIAIGADNSQDGHKPKIGFTLHVADVSGDSGDDLVVYGGSKAGNARGWSIFRGPISGPDKAFISDATTATDVPLNYTNIVPREVGDLDGDGVGDVLSGAASAGANGAVFVSFGPIATGRIAIDGDIALWGLGLTLPGGATPGIGNDITLIDDNGDGHNEIATSMAASTQDTEGGVVLIRPATPSSSWQSLGGSHNVATYSGVDTHFLYEPTGTGTRLGYSITATGDLDGDGDEDLVVGAPDANARGGAVHLLADLDGVEVSDSDSEAILDATAGGYLGERVYRMGDLDGDGLEELLLAEIRRDSQSATGGGAVWLLFGPTLE